MTFGAFAPLPLRLGGTSTEGWGPEEHARLAADLVAVTRTAPFARFRYTKSGSTVTISNYTGRNGSGSAFAPSVTVNGTGDVTFTWPAAYLDAYGAATFPDFDAGTAKPNGSGNASASIRLTANTARVLTGGLNSTATDIPVTVTVWGEAGLERRAVGDYGGDPNKRASETEGFIPYAAQWYREWQAIRGDAYTTRPGTLVHCENLALSRLWACWASRFPEQIRANAMPHRSDDKLPYWVNVLGVPVRDDDPKWLVRQRCAAHYKATKGPVQANVRQVLGELLGDLLVDVSTFEGTDIDSPPSPTYWPTVNTGPNTYNLGAGTWFSKRSHVLVQVAKPSSVELGRFLQTMNVDMFHLLDTLLPATATFSWVTFDVDGGVLGFFLDVSQLDLTGITES